MSDRFKVQVRSYGIGGKWRDKVRNLDKEAAKAKVKELQKADEKRIQGYQYRIVSDVPWTHR